MGSSASTCAAVPKKSAFSSLETSARPLLRKSDETTSVAAPGMTATPVGSMEVRRYLSQSQSPLLSSSFVVVKVAKKTGS